MTKYWCVNFEDYACLNHGINKNLWMMGYQYAEAPSDSGNRKAVITKNWRRLEEINAGDRFVAYLRGNRFYATGTVRTPRRPKTSHDPVDTIDDYLKRRKSYQTGYVYFTSVVYENFTDEVSEHPARIDVERWDDYVPRGVVTKVVNQIRLNERQKAVFEIKKSDFNRIAKALAGEHGSNPKERVDGGVKVAVGDSVVEALEKSHAKGQGFLLDSKLRKALEVYAMDAAKRHFTSLGYVVEDHSKGHPYDLRCTKTKETLHVEVKGTQTNGECVFLTAGEIDFARCHREDMALFLLHSISKSPGREVLSNGQKHLIVPWDVDQGCLKPVSYRYEVPNLDPS